MAWCFISTKEWIEKWMNFQSNFERLVLFCIEASDSESRRNRQHFSRSTRLTLFRTDPISKFQLKIVFFFARMNKIQFIFHSILRFFNENRYFSVKFGWNFAGISRNGGENGKNYTYVAEFAEFSRKFAEFCAICEVVHFARMKNSIQSLLLNHAERPQAERSC